MDSEAILIKKGKDYLNQREYQLAEEIFKKTAQLNPNNGQAYCELGKICCIQQRYTEAVEKLEKAIRLNQDDTCAHFLLGKAYKELNRYEESIIEFQKALELNYQEVSLHLDTINEQAYFEMGSIYYIQQRYLETIEKLEKAIAINPNYIFAHLLLAKSYKAKNEYLKSVREFERVLELGYKDENIHKELSGIYRILNKFDLAAKELKKALENGYEKKLYQTDLDNLYRQQIHLVQSLNFDGKYSEVLKEAERACKLIPKENLRSQNILHNEVEIAQKKISLSSKIRSLTITLTNKCNLACLMCQTRNTPWDLPKKTIQEIISLFPYLERIMWQGGEAFLFEGFKELLKEASRFPMRQVIATNGLLIDDEVAEIIVKSNVELTFSIDGATKEVYEHIRRGARFEEVIEKINLVNGLRSKLNSNMKTRLNVLIMRTNYYQIEEFLDFAKQYKFDTLFFNATGCDFKNLSENVFYYNQDKEVLEYINKIRLKIAKKAQDYEICLENWLPSFEFFNKNHTQVQKQENKQHKDEKLFCHAPWQRLYIDCGGNVRPDCLCLPERPVGNLLENTLEQIWNNEKIKEYRRKIVNHDYQNLCNPDCVWGRVPEKNLKFV